MSTQNTTLVLVNGKFKVDQFCRRDGNPSGQGLTTLRFLKSAPMDEFRVAVEKCHFIEQQEKFSRWMKVVAENRGGCLLETSRKFHALNPELSEYTGASVLQIILDSGGMALWDGWGLEEEETCLEWAYLIDLDENVFQIHHASPHDKTLIELSEIDGKTVESRWIPRIASFPLDNLPHEQEFLTIEHDPA